MSARVNVWVSVYAPAIKRISEFTCLFISVQAATRNAMVIIVANGYGVLNSNLRWNCGISLSVNILWKVGI